MSLKHIVPSLGLIALATTASAVEVGDLTIGGFVDVVLENVTDKGNVKTQDSNMEFTAAAEIQLGYSIGEAVEAQIDYELDSNDLEQANIAWAVSEQVTLRAGLMQTFLGYEDIDAPGLYRVNTSQVAGVTGEEITGAEVAFNINEDMAASLFILNDNVISGVAAEKTNDISIGLDFAWGNADLGLNLDFELIFEKDAAGDSVTQFGLNGDWTGVEDKLVVMWDIASRTTETIDSSMAFMVGANYKFQDNMSATLMLSQLEPDADTDDDELFEIAIALLTNPTNDENFALNAEIEIVDPAADGAKSETGIYVEMLALIP